MPLAVFAPEVFGVTGINGSFANLVLAVLVGFSAQER